MDETIEGSSQLFRPTKKRKVFRKTTTSATDDEFAASLPDELRPDTAGKGSLSRVEAESNIQDSNISVTELIRQRQALQRRRGGVEFGKEAKPDKPPSQPEPQSQVLIVAGPEGIALSRFSRQAGIVHETDQHMTAYIDHELAKRSHVQKESRDPQITTRPSSFPGPIPASQPAKPGMAVNRIQEIDLGPDARARNIAATEAAQRKLQGLEPEQDERKPKLRRDGKPWRRKQRNSEDAKRDKLVEDILHETKLDIYDTPKPVTAPNDDQAADDRLAEQFRREFMDVVAQRKQKASSAAKAGTADPSKGPKLGGSRAARAQMAAMKEQQEKGARKG